MMNLTDIGKQIKSTSQALAKADAELKWELAASAADAAGLIDPTPTSDLIGAGLSLRKGDFLGAGLSVVSMVPYLGDALAKPAKGVRAAKRVNELRQTVTKLSASLNDLRKAEKEAQAAEAAAKEARIAKEAAEAKTAKEAAEGQKAGAKGGKDKDCEDCSASSNAKQPSKAIPQTKVPCFHPFDKVKFKRLGAEGQKEYLREMSRQLSRQQDAINNLSANEFKAARQAFRDSNRNPFAAGAQASVREEFQETIRDGIYASLRKKKLSISAAGELAEQRAAAVMEKLAALHDPDMVAGGWMHPEPTGVGRKDVNSSIGGSWNQNGRVATLDRAAEDAILNGNGDSKMNIKLEPCRGKGIR